MSSSIADLVIDFSFPLFNFFKANQPRELNGLSALTETNFVAVTGEAPQDLSFNTLQYFGDFIFISFHT